MNRRLKKYLLTNGDILYSELEHMHRKFDKKLASLYQMKLAVCQWHTRQWIDMTIDILDRYKEDINAIPWSTNVRRLAKHFKVSVEDGKKILVIHEESEIHMLKVLSMDEYFDALWKSHTKTFHSGRLHMERYLRTILQVYVPTSAIVWFLKFCRICNALIKPPVVPKLAKRVNDTENIDHHGYIDIIDMSQKPDGCYLYIMYYKDMTTDCIFLRPLESQLPEDVAQELLKIFFDIGFPAVLHTSTKTLFIESIIRELKQELPEILIIPGENMNSEEITIQKKTIENMVCKCRRRRHIKTWSVETYFVQFRMNSHRIDNTPFSPYTNLLGYNPNQRPQTVGITPILKSIKYEEDLDKVTGENEYSSDDMDIVSKDDRAGQSHQVDLKTLSCPNQVQKVSLGWIQRLNSYKETVEDIKIIQNGKSNETKPNDEDSSIKIRCVRTYARKPKSTEKSKSDPNIKIEVIDNKYSDDRDEKNRHENTVNHLKPNKDIVSQANLENVCADTIDAIKTMDDANNTEKNILVLQNKDILTDAHAIPKIPLHKMTKRQRYEYERSTGVINLPETENILSTIDSTELVQFGEISKYLYSTKSRKLRPKPVVLNASL